MQELALPPFDYRVKKQEGNFFIYDVIRRKYVALTPEEWVRQHFIHYLIRVKHYSPALIAVEKETGLYGLKRRFDLVCYDRQGMPYLIVECKAATVPLSQQVFDQVFGYNLAMAARYIAVTNGIRHFCGYLDEEKQFCFLPDIPEPAYRK